MLRYGLVVFVCIFRVQSSFVTLVSPTGRANEGLLQLNINGTEGSVCDDNFDSVAAGVVCAQLGYSRTNATVVPNGYFGHGSGPILLDDVHCAGNETDILQCSSEHVGVSNCRHSEDVGVICHPDCQSNRMDLVFLLDSSSSEGNTNFAMQKDFVSHLVDRLTIGPNNVQVAVVTFSTTAHVYAYLDRYTTKSTLKTAIRHIPYTTGGTNTHEALKVVRTKVFGSHGDRSNAQNILIVLTDGKSRTPSLTQSEAALLRTNNVKTYVVGIGSSVTKTEIEAIAFTPQYAYNLAGFSSLSSFVSALVGQLCDAHATTITCGEHICDTRQRYNTCLLSISFASKPPSIYSGVCGYECAQHLLFSNRHYPECNGHSSSTTCCCRTQDCINAIVTTPTTTTLPTTTTTQAVHNHINCGGIICDTFRHYTCILHLTRGRWYTYPSCVTVNTFYPSCIAGHSYSPCSCTTQSCIDGLLSLNTQTTQPTPTLSTAATSTTSLSPTTTEEPCKDHDPYNYCSDTVTTTCNPTDEREWLFARKVCAKTCGLCISQLSHVCEDNDHNNYCTEAKDIICQLSDPEHHDFAVQACAKTCGLCDEYNELYGATYERTTAAQGATLDMVGSMIG